MKRIACFALVLMIALSVFFSACAEYNVLTYSEKIKAVSVWNRIDYNCVYQNAARDVLPELLSYRGDTINTYSARIFGDDTGEVWLIYEQEVYRVWFDEAGRLVLTSTSDGLGYTGYAVFDSK